MIAVLGMDGSGLSGPAARLLAGASLVAGARRHLESVPLPAGAETVVLGDVAAAADRLLAHPGPAAVLASGDPGFFGIVRLLAGRGADLQVLPATSSVAQAFARLALPWDDALVVSAHGRQLGPALAAARAHPKVAVLTGPGAGPAEIGSGLAGVERDLVVAERLGAPDEQVTRCTPAEAAGRAWAEPNVVLSLAPHRAAGPRPWRWPPAAAGGWALPDDSFAHRAGMVTKPEVRALALARLAPAPGALVWDVGAGSGSVAVECARLGAAVLAVEADPAACRLIRDNAGAHGVDVTVVPGTAPGALAGLPEPDAAFIGGGGPEVVAAVAARGPARVVAALATVERVGPTLEALAGYRTDAVLLSAQRLAPLGGGHRLAPANPVFLVWGER